MSQGPVRVRKAGFSRTLGRASEFIAVLTAGFLEEFFAAFLFAAGTSTSSFIKCLSSLGGRFIKPPGED